MKKQFLILLAGILLGTTLYAKKVNGIIITNKDTLHVKIIVPIVLFSAANEIQSLQHKIKYFDSDGNKVKVDPAITKEVRLTINNKERRLIKLMNSNFLFKKHANFPCIFLEIIKDGKLKVYNYYFTTGSGNNQYSSQWHVIQKEDGWLVEVKGIDFRFRLNTFFKDCPELVNKIEKREFKMRHFWDIVKFYDANGMLQILYMFKKNKGLDF